MIANVTESTERSVLRLFSLWISQEALGNDNNDDENDNDDRAKDWFEKVLYPANEDDDDDDDTDTDFWNKDLDTQWCTVPVLQRAIRYAARNTRPIPQWIMDRAADKNMFAKQRRDLLLLYQQKWAIRAFQLLQDQGTMIRLQSVSTSTEQQQQHGVRVTATSRCIGRSTTVGHSTTTTTSDLKYRFAYRIRIENVHASDTIQLLGRTWDIQELDDSNNNKPVGEAVKVHAPQTGAVGKLPVLQPGQAFEYMSGCELGTRTGVMSGCFHLSTVNADTPSAHVGMRVEAFDMDAGRFQVDVAPFLLHVDPKATFA